MRKFLKKLGFDCNYCEHRGECPTADPMRAVLTLLLDVEALGTHLKGDGGGWMHRSHGNDACRDPFAPCDHYIERREWAPRPTGDCAGDGHHLCKICCNYGAGVGAGAGGVP